MTINCNKIFFISDLHLGVRSNALEWLEIQKDYYENFFIPFLEKNKKEGDILFVLGDVFDNRQSINLKILNYGLELFNKIQKILPVYIIIGNHDIHMKTSNEINSVKIFSLLPNVTVFQDPEVVNLNNKQVLILPWRATSTEERDILETYKNVNYVFCHTDISGFQYNKFVVCETGNSVSEYMSFNYVFSGHIHYRQEVGNIIMLGCPYQLTRSDMSNHKGIYVFNPKDDSLEFYENNYSPKFIKLHLDTILNMSLNEFQKRINNNFVDIIVSNNWTLDFPFDRLFKEVENYRKINIMVENEDEDNDYIFDETLLEKFDIMQFSNKYIESLPYGTKTKKILNKKLEELYNKVVEK